MAQNRSRRSPGFALIVGIGFGLLIALVKKKIAFGLLIGILIAAIIYKRDKR
jgi:4-amino-4-deoxy-L-arabinose transferase-like glycosyltransferase